VIAMRLGVLTSGGDCPGLNAVIRAIARKAEVQYHDDLFGFLDAWRGVMAREWKPLTIETCRGLLPRGGTILGTSRVTPFQTQGGVDLVREVIDEMSLDGFIVIGGNGSLACAHELDGAGIRCIGVPKTIDNDIACTELTFGFDTALHVASAAIDRLHTTAEAHDRVLVVEVMGRNAGHVAVRAGLAGGAALTLIPEHPFDVAEVCTAIERRHHAGRYATIVVVAEGARPAPGTWELAEPEVDDFGHLRLGGPTGVGVALAAEIEARTGFETRVTVLGHVQRGGTPTAFDRVLSTRYGLAAIDAAHDGAWDHMVALQQDRIVRVPLADATAELKTVSDEMWEAASAFFA
jgi:6-phosphofructokinase 1